MKKTPAIIVDDFFDYPDSIRNWALSDELKYMADENGTWPGERTEITKTDFGNRFAQQVSNLLYDFSGEGYCLNYSCYFQKVKKTNYNSDSLMHQGWIHTDPGKYTGILYLNKNFPAKSGTTIFEPLPGKDVNDQSLKYEYYKGNKINEDEYMKEIKENNENFIPTIPVANKYNRLFLFEANQYHGVESFYSDTDEDRLTIAFFAHNMETIAKSPLERMKERY